MVAPGKTELKVSRIGFGGLPIRSADLENAEKLIRNAFYQGINFFNTADYQRNRRIRVLHLFYSGCNE